MVVIFQVPGMPMAEVVFAEGYDPVELAPTTVPAGAPYWFVERPYLASMYEKHGDHREAWEVTEESIGRAPDGVGQA